MFMITMNPGTVYDARQFDGFNCFDSSDCIKARDDAQNRF